MHGPILIKQTNDPKYPYRVYELTNRQKAWQDFVQWFNKQVEDRKIVTTPTCERYVEVEAKRFGIDVECSFKNGVININVLLPKPVTCEITAVSSKLYDKQKYEKMREQLVKEYGRDLGTFCTNRFASMIRKRRIEYICDLGVCREGNEEDRLRMEEVKRNHHFGWREKTFEFKQHTVPHSATSRDCKTLRVTLYIAIGD